MPKEAFVVLFVLLQLRMVTDLNNGRHWQQIKIILGNVYCLLCEHNFQVAYESTVMGLVRDLLN